MCRLAKSGQSPTIPIPEIASQGRPLPLHSLKDAVSGSSSHHEGISPSRILLGQKKARRENRFETMTWPISTSCQAAGPHFSLELIVWLIKCTPPSSGGMQLPTRVQQKEAWIIINKKIPTPQEHRAHSTILYQFVISQGAHARTRS